MNRLCIGIPLFLLFLVACAPTASPIPTPHARAIQRAIWVWAEATDIINGSDTARADFFAFCAAPHGDSSKAITAIYLSAREHLIGNDTQRAQLREFLVYAHNHGLRVEYLAGDPGWATPSHRANGEERCDAFVEFNQATSTITERFDGLHYDVEPYTLSDWETNYDIYWNQYTTLLRNCQEKIDTYNSNYDPDVTFACDIPRWYDTDSGAIGSVTSNYEIQDIVDYVTSMDYRDDADNIISDAENEIDYGDCRRQVVIGVETNDAAPEPESITFYEEGEQAMKAELATVLETYCRRPAFGGIAIHDYKGYADLPTGPRVCVVSVGVQINDDEPVAYEEPITITLRAGDALRLVNLRYCICPEAQPDGVAGEAYLFKHGVVSWDDGRFTRGGPIGCGDVGEFEGSWVMEPGQHQMVIYLLHYFGDTHAVDDRFHFDLDVRP